MTHEEFAARVAQLEQQALAHPQRYRWKVRVFASLGTLFLLSVIILTLLLMVVLAASIALLKFVAVKFLILLAPFCWLLLKSLWVTLPPTAGLRLHAQQSPELFALVTQWRQRLGCAPVHRIYLTEEMNAGICQKPRWGWLGSENHLILGLPLLQALTTEQFKAVLAHELGHIARGDGLISGNLYHLHQRWGQLMSALEAQQSAAQKLFLPFLRWFMPRLDAYTFPLKRANEYLADAAAARLTSAQTAAQALTGVAMVSAYLQQHYWPELYAQVQTSAQPPYAPYSQLLQHLSPSLQAQNIDTWLEQALTQDTHYADTHPALRDRLHALGAAAEFAPPPTPAQAASQLLGPALPQLTQNLDQNWLQQVQDEWAERYQTRQTELARLHSLNAQLAQGQPLTPHEACERAQLTETVGEDPDAALQQWHSLWAEHPEAAWLALSLGVRLLHRQDAAGVALLEQAMQLDPDTRPQACTALRDYYWAQGAEELAHDWHHRRQQSEQDQQGGEDERNHVRINDRFEAHGLDAENLQAIQTALKAIPGLRVAYLVRKHTRFQPHKPALYVLGFQVTAFWQRHRPERSQTVLAQIQAQIPFPGETLILGLDGGNSRFRRKLRAVRGSQIV